MPSRDDRTISIVLGFLVAASCGGAQTSGPLSYTVEDSGSVRVVKNHVAAWPVGEEWSIETTPASRIGIVEGDTAYQFHRVGAVDLVHDGSVVVLDGGSRQVRRYSADGQHQWSVGGPGQGPGEFEQPGYIGHRADGSVLVWDRALIRLTVIGPRGQVATTETYGSASEDPPVAYGMFEDGALLTVFPHSIAPPAPGALLRDTISLWRFDRATHGRALVARLPGPLWIWTGRYQLLVPFTSNPLRAIAGSQLLTAGGAAAEVRRYEASGKLSARYVLPFTSPEVTTSDVEHVVDTWVAQRQYGASAAVWREWLGRMPLPELRPAFDRLLVDPTGNIWLRRFLPAMDSLTGPVWDVLQPDGVYLGSASTPVGLEVMVVAERAIAGVVRDSLGVEQVRIHEIRKDRW